MTFEEALRAELITINNLNNKVFPLNATEGAAAPYLVYTSSEGINNKSLDGFLDAKGLSCEINILDTTYSNMKSLTKLVINVLKTFEGRVVGINGPFIQEIVFEDDCPELYEDQVYLYRKIINIRVYFKEG